MQRLNHSSHSPRRVLAFALFAAMLAVLLIAPARALTVMVVVESNEGPEGGKATVPILVEDAQELGSMHIELTFDPAVLEAESVEKGELLGDNAQIEFNTAETGRVIIGLISTDDIVGSGEIARVKFNVIGAKGQSTTLDLEAVRAWEGNETLFDIAVMTIPGQFTVTGEESAFPWWWLIVAAIVVLLLLVLLAKRRRRPQPAPAAAGPEAPAPAAVAPPPPAAAPTAAAPPVEAPPPAVTPTAAPSVDGEAGEPRFCDNCGAQVRASALFCPKCGTRLA